MRLLGGEVPLTKSKLCSIMMPSILVPIKLSNLEFGCFRYVELVEVLVRDSVSTLRRGEDGKYPERASRNTAQSKFVDIFVPPHLYGQLAQHKEGLELLLESGDISSLIATVNGQKASNTEETRELKAALWALAHFATSVDSVPLLDEGRVIESMVELGRFCPILSVRHTVFHCLCLICVTMVGAEVLRKWGWHAMVSWLVNDYGKLLNSMCLFSNAATKSS